MNQTESNERSEPEKMAGLDWRVSAKETPDVGRWVLVDFQHNNDNPVIALLVTTTKNTYFGKRWAYFERPQDPRKEALRKFTAQRESLVPQAVRDAFVSGWDACENALYEQN